MRTILLFFGIIFISCQSGQSNLESDHDSSDQKESIKAALNFLNDYVDFINDFDNKIDLIEWVEKRKDVTESFESELQRLINKARSENPNLGLGFDPILDAQDSPEEFKYSRSADEYIILEGADWSEFKVIMRLNKQDGNWLIEGSGVINIPKNKRIER